ncbi:hypothetical protein WDU94_015435 [Cyamophila willieti]
METFSSFFPSFVKVLPKIQPFNFGDDPLSSLEFTTVMCMVPAGDLPLNISWLFNNATLNPARHSVAISQTNRVSTLTIDAVTYEHSGNYTCVASNAAGVSSHSAILKVNGQSAADVYFLLPHKVPPKVQPFSFGEEPLEEGDTASIQCLVLNGDLPLNMTWLFNGAAIDSEDISVSQNSKRVSALTIESVKHHHAGNYSCAASNIAASSLYSAVLLVNVLPKVSSFSFGDAPLEAGQSATVQCSLIEGDPPYQFTWLLNSRPLPQDLDINSIKISHRVNVLSIESVSESHVGNYTCLVNSSVGSVNFTARLFVNEPPSLIPFRFGLEPASPGDLVQVTCIATKGDVPIRFHWRFSHGRMPPGTYVTQIGDRTSLLMISAVTTLHQGLYTCSAQNRAASVACMISEGDLPINITWSYGPPQRGVSVNRVGGKASMLVIEKTGYEHRGTYTCTATNRAGYSTYSSLLYVNVPPKIVPFSFESPIFAGESTQVTCLVSQGDKPLEIHWFYNTTSIDGITTQNVGNKGSLLLIDAAGFEHNGHYMCRVKNPAGVAEFTSVLNVHVPPRIIPFTFEEPIFAGESAQVTCLISQGDNPLNISWSFSSAEDLSKLGILVQSLGGKGSHLLIEAAGSQHRGNYSCIVSNRAGTIRYSTSLNVHVSPKVVPFSFEEPIFAGESAQVTCLVSQGDEPLEISWKFSSPHNFTNFISLGIVTQSLGRRGSTLLIESTESRHRGNYTCLVTNKASTTSFTTMLNVHVPPRIVPFSFEEPIFAGQSIQVGCSVSAGDAPIHIEWKLSGTDIPSDFGVEIQSLGRRGSALIVDSADSKHGGNYTCSATNAAGTVHYTTTLNVHEPIFAGQAAQVTCLVSEGDAPIHFSWQLSGKDIPKDIGIDILNIGRRGSNLMIESAESRHGGNYTCIVNNTAGTVRYTTLLNVHEPIFAGQAAQVTCLVSDGDLPIDISWQFHGNVDMSELGVSINRIGSKTSLLLIETSTGAHQGNYTCVSKNKAGVTAYTTTLHVHGKPTPFALCLNPLPLCEDLK